MADIDATAFGATHLLQIAQKPADVACLLPSKCCFHILLA